MQRLLKQQPRHNCPNCCDGGITEIHSSSTVYCYMCGNTARKVMQELIWNLHSSVNVKSKRLTSKGQRGTLNMKVQSTGGNWIKKANIKAGDKIKILDAGKQVDGKFGLQTVFTVQKNDVEIGSHGVNQTSLNSLVRSWGDDTEKWIGRVAVYAVRRITSKFGERDVMTLIAESGRLSS